MMDDSLGSKAREHANVEEIARLRAEVTEAKRLLDPAVVEAARYLLRNADTHPHTCCVKCAAAITEAEAEVARLTRELGEARATGGAVQGLRAPDRRRAEEED